MLRVLCYSLLVKVERYRKKERECTRETERQRDRETERQRDREISVRLIA